MSFCLGEVRQYRLFRAHVNFGTDSKFYPYDTQRPTLKLQSLDYGKNEISLTTKVLNNLNKINPEALDAKDLTDLSTIQGRFWIFGPENCLKEITFGPDSKLDRTKSANSNNLLNQKLHPYSLFSFDDDFIF